ncbi:hypothetical protein ACWY7A_003493 [Acinetobacter baumannii]|uniref:Uncharacterized protein n=1 Tax=Acinetobacter nosocomialis TaxID=106654 RepID=A0AB36M5E0_ACINO|nr:MULTISPECIES: hypothetical protein [Acinetobacter]AJB47667.1 hypothetical protein RR32_05940 [Acinetobacter nosocomialis]MBD0542355.1 hypothetical protein [Acinetobacter baumannii]MBD8351733.1 hypothetical protein [Acinetobacter nosocomialis]MBJ8460527.1 hypothetical protein [Acinetobacter nosocomialis]MBJ9727121.1 hypothetical protein [Acinetobacter nosocomialis]
MYSDQVINERLQQELINAVKTVQDEMKINFTHVNVQFDIYGDQSKLSFELLPEEYSRPNA